MCNVKTVLIRSAVHESTLNVGLEVLGHRAVGVKQQKPFESERQAADCVVDLAGMVNVRMEMRMMGVSVGDIQSAIRTSAVQDMNVVAPARNTPEARFEIELFHECEHDDGKRKATAN